MNEYPNDNLLLAFDRARSTISSNDHKAIAADGENLKDLLYKSAMTVIQLFYYAPWYQDP